MSDQENNTGRGDPVEQLEQEAKLLKTEAEAIESKAEKLEDKAEKLVEEQPDVEAKRPLEVVVNDKYKVTLQGKNQTGLSVKQAAIAQGAPIQIDFVLSIELGGGKTDIIGNDQPIKVKNGERFLAIPDDDNS